VNKRKIKSLIITLSLVFSMSLLQGCQSLSDKFIDRAVNGILGNDSWEESSDEVYEEQENDLETKENASDSEKEKQKSSSDKNEVKDNNSSKGSDSKESKSAKNITSNSKAKSSNTSSTGAYDKKRLQELLETNIALAKDTEVTITADISMDQLGDIALEVAEKNGFGGYIKNVSYGLSGRKAKIIYNYVDGKEGFLKKYNYVNDKINSILATVVKSGMSDYEKELALHDYIVNYSRYDIENLDRNTVPRDSYTAYGLLANKTAVCSGYAEVMYRLLNKAGIETHIVTGKSRNQNHAWNLVKIAGKYYHLDSTFDDPVTQDKSNTLSYNYFNLSDNEIANDHSWNKSHYPAATSTEANYFYVNNLVAKNYDEFCNLIKKALLNKKEKILIKTSTYDTKVFNPSALEEVVRKNKIDYINSQYSYSYDANTRVFQFEVKYK